jgi:peptidoglycan/LPS O-acetylase OafA/YrhL
MAKFVPHFEVLRGLAALWVFASHVLTITDLHIPVISRGALAVDVFIALSGFVIALMIINEAENYPRYIFRRFVRLYPLFIFAVILGMATLHLYATVIGSSPWAAEIRPAFFTRDQNGANFFWTHLLLHLTMLHGVVPDEVLPQAPLMFSGPLWSISLEWQFYLVAPFLVPLFHVTSARKVLLAVSVLLGLVFLSVVGRHLWHAEVPSFLPLKLPLFCVGIVCAVVWPRVKEMDPRQLLVLVGVAAVISMALTSSRTAVLIWFATYFCAAAGGKTMITQAVESFVRLPAARFLGRISYGLYVLHMPVLLMVAASIVVPIAGSQSKIAAALLLAAIGLPFVIALSAAAFYGIEKPLIAWARHFGRGYLSRKLPA